ncbi:MAG: iron-containing alcohol dehydrogenase, partial [Kiritimatiellota bacterium]|nr:iron-containing alcohol dehydrogenase [Kiritimatiellota bacterium]
RPLLFTDQGVVKAGVAELVLAAARDANLEVAGVFAGVLQDARIAIINEGAAFYRQTEADSVIAVGGGSVMDTVKAVNILIGQGEEDFQPLADQAGLYEEARQLPPHIAFPTTAGTGCEVTSAMVVLDTNAQAKLSVTHPFCNADVAMLDPELTVNLPARITAATGMDALTHAIEGITSRGAQPISDALGLHAIRLIFTALPRAVKNPTDMDARGNMLIASTIAGMCFINSMCGAVHATAHALGARYGIPHGLANAIMLPPVMAFNLEEIPERYLMIADAMGINVNGMSPREAGARAIEAVIKLKRVIGLTDTLADFGLPEDPEALAGLVELAASDGQIGYNPRYREENDILSLYLNARK